MKIKWTEKSNQWFESEHLPFAVYFNVHCYGQFGWTGTMFSGGKDVASFHGDSFDEAIGNAEEMYKNYVSTSIEAYHKIFG